MRLGFSVHHVPNCYVLSTLSLLIVSCLSTAQTASGQTAQAYYRRGEIFFRQGNYQSALDSCDKAIEAASQSGQLHPQAHLLRGVIYQDRHKNYLRAIEDYKAYLTQPDHNKNIALKRLAEAYFDLGLFYRSLFNTAVNIEIGYYTYKLDLAVLLPSAVVPDNLPYLRYTRGLCYYLAGRFDEGIADLEQVAQDLYPDSPSTDASNHHSGLSEQTLHHTGKKRIPLYHWVQLKLAACYYRIGQTEQSEQIFAQVQQHIDAKTDALEAIMLSVDLYRTYLELSRLEYGKQAAQACQKAVDYLAAHQPQDTASLNRVVRSLSYAHYVNGDIEQALAQLENLDLTVPDFAVTLSDGLPKAGSASTALTDRENARTVDISYYVPSIFQQKSHIFFQLASKAYTELYTPPSTPSDTQYAMSKVGFCHLYTNQFEQAIPIFESLRTESADKYLQAQAAIYLGIIAYLSDQDSGPSTAQQIWEEVLETFPDDIDVYSETAFCWAELGVHMPRLLSLYQQSGASLPEAPEMYNANNKSRRQRLTRQLGYVYLQLGIHEKTPDQKNRYLNHALLHFQKNRSRVGYLFDEPLLLVNLAQSYYHKRFFDVSADIWQNFLSGYPEVIQILEALQIISEIAMSVWPAGQMPDPDWVDLNYLYIK